MGMKPMASVSVTGDPDPKRFKIESVQKTGVFCLVVVVYPDCTNFGGKKIMVYELADESSGHLDFFLDAKSLDPHFCEDKISPIARFRPDAQGLARAKLFCKTLADIRQQVGASAQDRARNKAKALKKGEFSVRGGDTVQRNKK